MTRCTNADLPPAHAQGGALWQGRWWAGGKRSLPSPPTWEPLKQTLRGLCCPHGGSPPLEIPIRSQQWSRGFNAGNFWCVQCCQDSDFKTLSPPPTTVNVSLGRFATWVSLHCTEGRMVFIAELNALWCPW